MAEFNVKFSKLSPDTPPNDPPQQGGPSGSNPPNSVINPNGNVVYNWGDNFIKNNSHNMTNAPAEASASPAEESWVNLTTDDIVNTITQMGEASMNHPSVDALIADYCADKDYRNEVNDSISNYEALIEQKYENGEISKEDYDAFKANLKQLKETLKKAYKDFKPHAKHETPTLKIGYNTDVQDASAVRGKKEKIDIDALANEIYNDLKDKVNQYGYTKDADVLALMEDYKDQILDLSPKEQAELCKKFRYLDLTMTHRLASNLFSKDVVAGVNASISRDASKNNEKLLGKYTGEDKGAATDGSWENLSLSEKMIRTECWRNRGSN